jgi:hypothetical protein
MGHDAERSHRDLPSPKRSGEVSSPLIFSTVLALDGDLHVLPAVTERTTDDLPTSGASHQARTRKNTKASRIGGQRSKSQAQVTTQRKGPDLESAQLSDGWRSSFDRSGRVSSIPFVTLPRLPNITSSYTEHTDSSRAGQNSKVELQRTRSLGVAAKRLPKSPLPQRSSTAHDFRSLPSSPCRSRHPPSNHSVWASSTLITAKKSTFSTNDARILHHTEEEWNKKRSQRRVDPNFRERLGEKEFNEPGGVNRRLDDVREVGKDTLVEEFLEIKLELEQPVMNIKLSQHDLIHARDTEEELIQYPEELLVKNREAQEYILKNKELQARIEELDKKLRDIEQWREEAHQSEDALWQLRKRVDDIATAVALIPKSFYGSTTDLHALNSFSPHPDSEPEIYTLHSNLLQLLRQHGKEAQLLSHAHDETQKRLATKEDELNQALRAEAVSTNDKQARDKLWWQYERDSWEALYRDELQQRKQTEERFHKFQETAARYHQPELERQNRELQNDLNTTLDENRSLREQTKTYMRRAQQCKTDLKIYKAEYDTRSAGLESKIKAQHDEMLLYIQDYYNKTRDDEHWELGGLQKRMLSLEKELHKTNHAFDRTKSEKARLEDNVATLMDTNTRYQREVEQLQRGLILRRDGDALPLAAANPGPFGSPPFNPQLSPTKKAPDKPNMPPCHLAVATAKRAKILKDLLRDQQQRKKDDAEMLTIMDKIKKWKMNKTVPAREAKARALVKEDSVEPVAQRGGQGVC